MIDRSAVPVPNRIKFADSSVLLYSTQYSSTLLDFQETEIRYQIQEYTVPNSEVIAMLCVARIEYV